MINMKKNKWHNFVKELSNLIFFWLFGVCFFFVFRVLFIVIYSKETSEGIGFNEYYKVLLMGFRYDASITAYFLIIPFLALLFLSFLGLFNVIRSVRKIFQYLFVILSSIITVVTINYYAEYNNQFNNFLFLALYDDQKAVAGTILKDFHPVANLLSLLLIIVSSIYIFKFYEKKETIYRFLNKPKFRFYQYILVFVSIVLFVFSIRGSVNDIPIKRRMAGVSKDLFLNKTITNPFFSLNYAYEDFRELNASNGENPFMKEEEFLKTYPKKYVSDYIERTAPGTDKDKPKQIFIVIMESYDSWPLLKKYESFGFSKELSHIAENGTHFVNFLPAANATFFSYGAIVTNIPYCGVNISHLGETREQYVTSIFAQFKKLGYQTNLFYGGFLSWENIGEFSKHQGVDHIFCATDIGGEADEGLWGVPDRKLFDLVLEKTDADKYSLNIILTTSYHTPYSINVEKEGFPYRSARDFPKNVAKYYDNAMTINELGHLWYGDKAIGEFVLKAKDKYKDGVFTFTGDHFGRKFINHKPNLYEKSSVPFIMYGKNIPKEISKVPGSHIDIMPTLIEMVAPKDFKYYSFGTSLFSQNKKDAIAYRKYMDYTDLYSFPKEEKLVKYNLKTAHETQLDKNNVEKKHNKLMSLAWYYTMKGNEIKPNKE